LQTSRAHGFLAGRRGTVCLMTKWLEAVNLVLQARCLGEFEMTNWKADFDALVEETMSFAKKYSLDPPMPRTIVEPSRLPPVNQSNLERDEIRQRVSNFKAHQERFARERDDYAAFQMKRMLGRSRPSEK
jgi:hypothetical protein